MDIKRILTCCFCAIISIANCDESIGDQAFPFFTHNLWQKNLWNKDLQCYLHYAPSNEELREKQCGSLLNVISVSLFRPPIKLRNKTSNKYAHDNQRANVYVTGLNSLIKSFHAFFPTWILRIYYDASLFVPNESETESFKALFELHRADKQLQFVQYYFPIFAEQNDCYHHQCVFGMLPRFLAIIDPSVSLAYIRDVDSELKQQDKDVVDQWLTTTQKDFLFYCSNNYKYDPLKPNFMSRLAWIPADKFCALGGLWAAKHQSIQILQEMLSVLIAAIDDPHALLRKGIYGSNVCGRGFDEFLLDFCIILKKEKEIAIYDRLTKEVRNWIQYPKIN